MCTNVQFLRLLTFHCLCMTEGLFQLILKEILNFETSIFKALFNNNKKKKI